MHSQMLVSIPTLQLTYKRLSSHQDGSVTSGHSNLWKHGYCLLNCTVVSLHRIMQANLIVRRNTTPSKQYTSSSLVRVYNRHPTISFLHSSSPHTLVMPSSFPSDQPHSTDGERQNQVRTKAMPRRLSLSANSPPCLIHIIQRTANCHIYLVQSVLSHRFTVSDRIQVLSAHISNW